jgi:hypothetical protein
LVWTILAETTDPVATVVVSRVIAADDPAPLMPRHDPRIEPWSAAVTVHGPPLVTSKPAVLKNWSDEISGVE